jgi:hypothetical protein
MARFRQRNIIFILHMRIPTFIKFEHEETFHFYDIMYFDTNIMYK